MDILPAGTDGRGPLPSGGGAVPSGSPAPRTGAFGALHTRWLLLWAGAGVALVSIAFEVIGELGISVSDELLSTILYLPVVAWIGIAVVRRGGVRLGALLRWPVLGTYWFVVAGMLVVQFVFSLAAITLTELVAPWMDDSLAGVGQGNLALALIGIVILPPIVEEITFRGILLERFAVKWRVGVAVVALRGLLRHPACGPRRRRHVRGDHRAALPADRVAVARDHHPPGQQLRRPAGHPPRRIRCRDPGAQALRGADVRGTVPAAERAVPRLVHRDALAVPGQPDPLPAP